MVDSFDLFKEMASDLKSLFKTGFMRTRLREYIEEIGYRLVGGLCLMGFHFTAKMLSTEEIKQCHILVAEVLDTMRSSSNISNPFILLYCQDILSNRVYVISNASGDIAEYKGFDFANFDNLLRTVYLPINFIFRTREQFYENFFANEDNGCYHKIELVNKLKKELLRSLYMSDGEFLDTEKLLNLRMNAYLHILYQHDTRIRAEEDQDIRESEVVIINMTLYAIYKNNIMFYELVKFLLQDFVKSLYCRIGEGEQRKLPKRIFCKYHDSLFSLYSFGEEIKVSLTGREP